MKLLRMFAFVLLFVVIAASPYAFWRVSVEAGYPYSMTYVPVTGNTVAADHINTSNNEHINNNIPGSIDDYSNTVGEMQATKDPFAGETEVQAVTLAEELQELRYQLLEIGKFIGIDVTQWYHNANSVLKKNAFINADSNIWQRGTSFAAIATGAYHADRFRYDKVGTMVHTVSRSTDVPSHAQSGHLSKYSILVDCTTADSSIAAGDTVFISKHIEGFNFLPLALQEMTLSFWHKHTKTGIYCVGSRNDGQDRSYVAEYTQTTTNTWERATVTISASPSGGTWDYTTGTGLKVSWVLANGTTRQGTADTWESANNVSTSNQVNACDNTANNFRLAQVRLELGAKATKFVGEDIATDLARSKRYYEELNNDAEVGYEFAIGACTATTTAIIPFVYEVEKRVAPTVTISTVSDFEVRRSLDESQAVTVFTFAAISKTGMTGTVTVAANLAGGNATRLVDILGNSRIYIDSEL